MSKKNPKLPPLPASDRIAADRAARQEARAERLREVQRGERRRRVLVQTGVGLAVVVLVVGATVLALTLRGEKAAPIAVGDRPAGFDAAGALAFGAADPKVTIQVVEDFQCPVCRQFEQVAGDLLDSYRSNPQVQVQYRPIAFLDRASTTRYSTRAANAAACVASEGKDAWSAYHRALYANQPPEGGAGLTDRQLLTLAEQAGADTDAIGDCVRDLAYGDWVQATTKAAFDAGVTGTPTVFVQGEKLDSFEPDAIRAAVEKALS